MQRSYLCIDLKSFYASVECVERGLDPLTTNLAVADPERSEKTVCLAISPSMKKMGIKNRCRVFQIPKGVTYIMAPPRMKLYIAYAAEIYGIYLQYVAKEDIHVYSVDEAFLDVTNYLQMYQMSAKELAVNIMQEIKRKTQITATAGIGTNLYLAKIALDIMAKHTADNVACLDEERYRKLLWEHKPLTDFWRIGAGTQKRLASMGITTMKEVAYAQEDVLYHMFGIDAELLIDHAWGRETTTIADIKNYKAQTNSLTNGQVLPRNYDSKEAEVIIKEMVDALCLDMTEKGLVTQSVSLVIGYDAKQQQSCAKGTVSLAVPTSSYQRIVKDVVALYQRIINPAIAIRRIHVTCNKVTSEIATQYDFFTDYVQLEKEQKMQQAALAIKRKFGKNALLRGMDLQEGATAIERNQQIGGHKSGE